MSLANEDRPSTTGENLGIEAAAVLKLARELVDTRLVPCEEDALLAIQDVLQAFESPPVALAAIDEVRAFLHRDIVPEYPGSVTTKDEQPRTTPHAKIQGDPETVDVVASGTLDVVGRRKIRPAPRIKDPALQKARPRLPDGLGQGNAQESEG